MERKHNDRYKKMDTKEVDSFLQSELDKAASKAKKEKLELNQKTLLDLLQHDQMPIKEIKESKEIKETKEIKESKEATKKLEHQFDLLQEEQLHLHQQIQQRRTSSATSSPISKPSSVISSPHTSPSTSSPQSTCPICHKISTYETIVTWKDCQHAMVSIPYFSL